MSSDSETKMSRGVGPVFGGLRRALDGVSESISARPFGVLVFLGSVALLVYLQTSSLSSFRADAVARAQAVDHPAQVSSFVTAVYVLPGDTIDVGAPLVDLSSHFIDRELAQVDAEIEKLLHESRLAQARLLVEEQRWLSPSMRLQPDSPSLERPTEALYAKQLGVLQTRRTQLQADRRGLTVTSSHSGRVVHVAPPGSSVAAGSSVASVVAEYADEIVAYVPAETDPAEIAVGAPVYISRPSLSCRGAGRVLRRGASVEEGPSQLKNLFRFPVHGMPVYVSVPPDCRLGVGQVLSVEFPRVVM
jgi:multidrug resistance efflux pump